MSTISEPGPGIYGKVPSNGDFVTRRLPAAFVEPWDLWLQDALSDSRDQLGARWLEIYLTSPIWRFVLSPGLAGQDPWAGVLMPSVDRVGRYFPLTLACPLPVSGNPIQVMTGGGAWFGAAETLLLTCLEDDFDLAAFDRQVLEMGPPPAQPAASPMVPAAGNAFRVPLERATELATVCPELLRQALGELFFGYSLWWSEGSEMVQPSLLVCQGLPPTKGFSALLAGDWNQWGWDKYPAPISGDDPASRGSP
ncbi:MAG: type VI secretion system-associated protein TagF [Pseudomonadota bacterium]|nr:type VI secretion system-associated protein TagF [Pseudomonadota bacterium]